MTRHALFGLCATTLMLISSACTIDEVEPTVGCTQLSDCRVGQVCDVPARACIDEPTNRVIGRFACEVVETGANPNGFPGSELIASVGDPFGGRFRRVSLAQGATCTVNTSGLGIPGVDIFATDVTGQFGFIVTIDEARAQSGGRIPIGPWFPLEPNGGPLLDLFRDEYVATTASGFIEVQPIRLGTIANGYLDIELFQPVNEPGVVGVPCPRGQADCGLDVSGPFHADCGELGGINTCNLVCDTDNACIDLDAFCLIATPGQNGICVRPCDSDDDCIPPLACRSTPDEPREFCF